MTQSSSSSSSSTLTTFVGVKMIPIFIIAMISFIVLAAMEDDWDFENILNNPELLIEQVLEFHYVKEFISFFKSTISSSQDNEGAMLCIVCLTMIIISLTLNEQPTSSTTTTTLTTPPSTTTTKLTTTTKEPVVVKEVEEEVKEEEQQTEEEKKHEAEKLIAQQIIDNSFILTEKHANEANPQIALLNKQIIEEKEEHEQQKRNQINNKENGNDEETKEIEQEQISEEDRIAQQIIDYSFFLTEKYANEANPQIALLNKQIAQQKIEWESQNLPTIVAAE